MSIYQQARPGVKATLERVEIILNKLSPPGMEKVLTVIFFQGIK